MKTSVSAKRCPECGKVTMLHAAQCLDCGHQFRTRFQEPEDRTEAFDAMMLPRPPLPAAPLRRNRRPGTTLAFGLAFLGSFCLVATLGILAWLAWNVREDAALSRAQPVTYAAGPRAGRAEDLYERITISMSLYDLDQAAGGTGRVVRSKDPHALLLSYDFLDQSVRVSLYRSDLMGDDYRVQAVALYHGNTLLHRHADDN